MKLKLTFVAALAVAALTACADNGLTDPVPSLQGGRDLSRFDLNGNNHICEKYSWVKGRGYPKGLPAYRDDLYQEPAGTCPTYYSSRWVN